ncbi:Planctomycete cytochrome C [Symmachiella macrocystis]|uniref:Planctomycete cytochrome C n=1 Tax=Symmachiella macrocystis TaxID=2527985 RepID=A0A5C6BBK0_9PLAN|nr:DUF1553 domain-containing protein [Symmachiella macrocystis]TWU09360.1 Planctomycete cytochrome C [Symmachiella macrocystis]
MAVWTKQWLRRRVCGASILLWMIALLLGCATQLRADDAAEPVDFNRDIKPIFSDRCYTCHGPDEEQRQAELRLDRREGLLATVEAGEGTHVVKPGDLSNSEVFLRITSDDETLRMPPADANLDLTQGEIDLIKRWIEQGAVWDKHWSLLPIAEVTIPEVADSTWPRNAIDHFVLARLQREGLASAAEANKERLIRRLTFDLTGLPPTLEEIDTFLADDSAEAYEKVVDRLLASPRYGERMAVDWLDVARYADTYGYQSDVYRAMWPWRDWVIEAFNNNLPYDQFITWQIAGDLLPNATRDQVLATAFNRHHRQTNEGGSIEAEFRTEYVADRVETFGTAFLGLTLQCARCHDHKYDAITQKNFYQLFGFFNNIDESGLYSHFTSAVPTPAQMLPTDEQASRIETTQAAVEAAESELAELAAARESAFQEWLAQRPRPTTVAGLIGDFPLESFDDNKVANRADAAQPGNTSDGPQIVPGKIGNALKMSGENNVTFKLGGDFTRDDPFSIALWVQTPDVKERAVIFHRSRAWTDSGSRGYQLLLKEGHLSAALIHFWPGNAIGIRATSPMPVGEWVHVVMAYDGSSRAAGLKLYVNGEHAECEVVRDKLSKQITGGGADTLTIGQRFRDRGFKNGLVDEFQVFNRPLTLLEVAEIYDGETLAALSDVAADELTDAQRQAMLAYYLANHDEPYRAKLAALQKLRRERSQQIDPVPEIMVMRELPQRRATFLLQRGAYDAPGAQVTPGVPEAILPFPENEPLNRLGLARWLTDPQHPLTARVAVNRFWQAMFGNGFVTTPEDFGNQGAAPTHPQLLDWLAKRFIDSGWDIKALQKLIVMSATYRQDSRTRPELRREDPQNLLLSRGPQQRLSAEMIRDNALFTSGLLVEKIGGPPVKPFQPAGLWKEKSSATYTRDAGEGSHRRSLYTYWKRTSPPPAMLTFDAAKRDVCAVKRQTTTTPLQALVLLNDPQYVEAARGLAERMLQKKDATLQDRVGQAFQLLTSRRAAERELELLSQLYEEQLAEFQQHPDQAAKLLAIGDHRSDETLDPAQLAALTVVVETIMNFDETVTKR